MRIGSLGAVSVSMTAAFLILSCGKSEESEVQPQYGMPKPQKQELRRKPTEMEKSTKIAFESTLSGGYDIWTINADGTDLRQLTRRSERNRFPSWSPDGTKIVFVSNQLKRSTFTIFIMNADGSNQVKISDIPGWNGHPEWSPDGTRIAYDSSSSGNIEIMVMKADGSNPVNLTNHPSRDSAPSWSPDGKKIAFISDRDGNEEIYTMNADGSGQVNLSNNKYSDDSPAWSPDGTKIAFVSTRDHVAGVEVEPPKMDEMALGPEYLEKAMQSRRTYDIFVMDADGSNPINLTHYSNNDFKPTWAPDGSRIAFISIRDGRRDVFSVNPDGTDVMRVTDDDAMQEYPDWGPKMK